MKFLNKVPTYALPLDLFRIGVGLLSLIYFIRTIYESKYFLRQDGFLNHELVQKIFWYTWQPLFNPQMSPLSINVILSVGVILSLCLIIGLRTRLSSFFLYFLVVCIYRYQFLVFFVDDVIMHLLLFWCMILPTGHTLNLVSWFKNKKIMDDWKKAKTDSFALNLFLYNIALIYFIAGVSKFSSKLWLDGVALLAVLKLPLGWFSQYPLEDYETLIKIGNYLALTMEPLFVLIVFLKPWNKFKMFLGIGICLFHLTILLTLDIPIANIGCLLLIPIIFRHEIMELLFHQVSKKENDQVRVIHHSHFAKVVALLMVVLLTGAMSCALTQEQWRSAKRVTGKNIEAQVRDSSADSGGLMQTGFYAGLWAMGLAQGYRLLDWIDERNFYQKVTVREDDGTSVKFFSRSNLVPIGMRGSLMMTYISDVTWMYVDPDHIENLRLDIRTRLSRFYCRSIKNKTSVEVWHTLTRIESFVPIYNKPEPLLKFSCQDSKLQNPKA